MERGKPERSDSTRAHSLSPEGLEALKRREGTRDHYYNDHPRDGNCTWGTGFLAHMGPCTPEETRRPVTQVEIDAELRRRASHAEDLVTRNLRQGVTQQQFDALGKLCLQHRWRCTASDSTGQCRGFEGGSRVD